MSDEPEVTQDLPEGEAVEETSAIETAPETDKEQAPQPDEEEAPKPKAKPWWQERIDHLTREKYEARRDADSYRTLAETLQAGGQKAEPNADVDSLATAKAAEMVKAQQFDAKCNAIYSSGTTEYGDFDQTLANFTMLGGLSPQLLEAVTQLPDAHKVLHSLGQDMDTAARILALPPMPMAIELAKLSVSPRKAAPVSNAPKPISPIDGSPRGEPDPDKMNYSEWETWREAQLKKRV